MNRPNTRPSVKRPGLGDPNAPVRIYAHLTFTKTGRLRYLSHLDLARAFDRAVRRAGLPVAYSEGFNPHARIAFASALGVGVAGEAELCALDLATAMRPNLLMSLLNAQLPEGMQVTKAVVGPRGRRSPFADIARAVYDICLKIIPDDASSYLDEAIAGMLAAPELLITRTTKSRVAEIDLRPGIFALARARNSSPGLTADLSIAESSLVKPAEVVSVLSTFATEAAGKPVAMEISQLTRVTLST